MFLTPLVVLLIVLGAGFAVQQRRKNTSIADPFAPPKPPRRVPAVAEALGYLGGILGVVGLVLLVGSYWDDMERVAKVAITGGATLLFVVGGYFVPEGTDATFTRLKWFLWLAATAFATTCGGVVAKEYITSDDVMRVVIGASIGGTVVSAALWLWKTRPFQQLTTLAGFAVVTGASVSQFTDMGPVGSAVWGVAIAYLALGLAQLTPMPELTVFVGSVAVIVGPMIASGEWKGAGLLVATASCVGLIGAGMLRRFVHHQASYVVLATIGFIGLLQSTLGMTIAHFAKDGGIATGLTVSAVGAITIIACDYRLLRQPIAMTCFGALASVLGLAVCGVQSFSFATISGLLMSVGLLALGALPQHAVLSIFGSLGLLIYVPWSIGHFFPGEVSAPLLLFISGVLIVAVAVLLSRMGGRFKRELASHR